MRGTAGPRGEGPGRPVSFGLQVVAPQIVPDPTQSREVFAGCSFVVSRSVVRGHACGSGPQPGLVGVTRCSPVSETARHAAAKMNSIGGNLIRQAQQRLLVNGLRASLDVALSAESLVLYSTHTRRDLLAVLREHADALEASLFQREFTPGSLGLSQSPPEARRDPGVAGGEQRGVYADWPPAGGINASW